MNEILNYFNEGEKEIIDNIKKNQNQKDSHPKKSLTIS